MAETHSEATATNNDDLFGESPNATTTETLEQDPGAETSGDEVEEATETPEAVEGAETEEEEAESTPPEPNVEVLKILAKKGISEDKFNEYLTRYRLTAEQANANPSIAHLVLDKAAADDLIAKTPKEEAKKEEVKQDPPDLEKHLADLKQRVTSEYTDPGVRANFVKQINEAKTAEEQFSVLELAAANLFNTMLEKRFGDAFTNYTAAHQRAIDESTRVHTEAWAPELAKNAELPKDALAAYEAAKKAEPELVGNKNLTPPQRMKIVAMILGGRKAEAEVVAKAAEKGKEQGAKAAQKAGLGKLGAGQSTAAIAKKTTGNDDVFGPVGESSMSQRLTGKYSS